MPKTVFTGSHRFLVETLVSARKKSGMTQAMLAEAVGKDQSFVSNIENSQRRVDVLEFYALARAMGADPVKLYAEVAKKLPQSIKI